MLKQFKLVLKNENKDLSVTAKLNSVLSDGDLQSFQVSFTAKLDDREIATLELVGERNRLENELSTVSLYQKSSVDIASLGAKGDDLLVLQGLEPAINKRQFVCDIMKDPTPTCFTSSIAMLMNMPKVKRDEVEAFQVMRKLAVLIEVGFGYRELFKESDESLEEDLECIIEPLDRFYKKGLSILL